MREIPHDRFAKEALLLDPDPGGVDRGEEIGPRAAGRVAGDQLGEAGAFGLGQGPASVAKALERDGIHRDGLDRAEQARAEAAGDEHPGAVEVAGVNDGDAGAAHHPQELDHGPAGLAMREHHQLVGVAAPGEAVDVIEERRLVLDDERAPDGELGDRRAAELGERNRDRVAEGGVGGDVIEAPAGLVVDERAETIGGERGLVAMDAAHLERVSQGLPIGDVATEVGGVAGGLVVIDEGARESAHAVGTGGEGLAVAKDVGGEVGDSDRARVGEGGIDAAGDALALEGRSVSAAAGGERAGLAGVAIARLELGVDEAARGIGADAGANSGERGGEITAQGGTFTGRVTRRAVERSVEQLVEAEPNLAAADVVGVAHVEADATGAGANGASGEDLAQGAGLARTRGERGRAREGAAALAPVEQLGEQRGESGTARTQRADVADAGLGAAHSWDASRARRLLGPDPEQAFDDGCAPELGRALDGRVTAAVAAERAPFYLNVMYALVLMRRGHELEPRHEDLYARVLPPQRLVGIYDLEAFATDVDQLVAWGALDRITEAQRLRGYKDNRRVRFRYRITADGIALIEWLEARLAAKLEGRVRDSRDRLADVIGALKEAKRVLDAWRKDERSGEAARRAYYLLEAAADAIGAVSDELLGFRAEMALFAQRPYDIDALREILGWLERYVQLYLGRVRELRAEIRDRLAMLSAPRYRQALAECRAEVERERQSAPRFVRAAGPLRGEAELLDAAVAFFQHDGRLADLCRYIDDAARAVVLKMHRHIRELERRSARLDELRATIAALAAHPTADDERLCGYVNHLVASAHGRFDRRPGTLGHRVAPPAPRKHELAADRRAATKPLAAKHAGLAEARALRAKLLAELGEWVHRRVLAGAPSALLSAAKLAEPADARRVIDLARAQHLAGGKHLRDLGVLAEPAPGRASIGTATAGLDAPDTSLSTDRSKP